MGGFNGSDHTPTLAQLQAYVASGQLRYVYLGGGGPGGLGGPGFGRFGGGPGGIGGGPNAGNARNTVAGWVTSTCTLVSVSGSLASGLYDCAGA
jgi:hypothetical protein